MCKSVCGTLPLQKGLWRIIDWFLSCTLVSLRAGAPPPRSSLEESAARGAPRPGREVARVALWRKSVAERQRVSWRVGVAERCPAGSAGERGAPRHASATLLSPE